MDMAVSAQVCIGRTGATCAWHHDRTRQRHFRPVPSQHSKVVIVTGGARGLGRACVERFLNDGAAVVAVDIDEAGLADCASQSDNSAKRLRTVIADVSNRIDIERAVDIAVREFGRLDVMINNAGIVRSQDFLAVTEDDFDQVLGVNLKGPFRCPGCRAGDDCRRQWWRHHQHVVDQRDPREFLRLRPTPSQRGD